MKQLLCCLAILCGMASVAIAGPNSGGVLWVHDTGLAYTGDMTLPPVSAPPTDCATVDTEQPLDGTQRIWKVYAAFPPGSSPRLKGLGWRIEFPEAGVGDPYVAMIEPGCGLPNEDGPGTDFAIPTEGFPTDSGGEIGQSFPTGPRTTTVVELYYFSGFAYSTTGATTPVSFNVAQTANPDNRYFLDDASPAQNADPIMGYGSLGFGQAGTAPCPTSDPDAACCAPGGGCMLTKESACTAPNTWHREWYVCDPNPCPLPTGACCYSDGRCQMPRESQCLLGGGVYQGDFTVCDPNPCPPIAACCLESGSCLVRTETACTTTLAGIWHAEWSSCTPNPCPAPPTGSCCAPNGACTVTAEAACTEGDWTLSGTCVPNLCPAPPDQESPCCTLQAECTMTLRVNCIEPSVWRPEFTACDPNPCQLPLGACCTLENSCTVTTQAACDPAANWYYQATSCDPNPCPALPVEPTSWGQIKNRYH